MGGKVALDFDSRFMGIEATAHFAFPAAKIGLTGGRL